MEMVSEDNKEKVPKQQYDEIEGSSCSEGLVFSVEQVATCMMAGNYAKRGHTIPAPVFLTAVLQYIAAQVLELAGNAAREVGKNRIEPPHILSALRNDEELNNLLARTFFEELSKMLGQVFVLEGSARVPSHSLEEDLSNMLDQVTIEEGFTMD